MSKGHILVVDDEQSILESLQDILADEGYRVTAVSDGEEAIGLSGAEPPDLVLLDVWLPGKDGIQTLQALRELWPGVDIIVMSGHGNIETAVKATKLGAFDFIEKPFSMESLLRAVEGALARRKGAAPASSPAPEAPPARGGAPGGEAERGSPSLREARREWERKFLSYHMARSEWDLEAAARHLQLKPTSLQRKLRALGLAPARPARRPASPRQRTLRRSVVLCGQGLHSGLKAGMILQPLPPGSGIHFGKITEEGTAPALVEYVVSTDYATTIRNGPVAARTIEHLMAVLHAYGIANLLVKISDEVPIMDGSALDFCQIVEDGGIEEQDEPAPEFVAEETFQVGEEGSPEGFIRLEPGEGFSITYTLDYPPPIGRQAFRYVHEGPEGFKREVAPARTFGFLREVEQLERLGLASGGRLDNLILLDDEKVINTELRFPDEFARHKVLDLMGDLYLLGRPIRGRVVAERTGHSDNIALLRTIREATRT